MGLKIFSFLTLICLLIALCGIYAVATASAKRRRKEIAIAGLIAFPVGYLAMSYWLRGYAYRIQIRIWWLAGIFIAITGMVLFTIWKQVFKAANENPSEVIKSE